MNVSTFVRVALATLSTTKSQLSKFSNERDLGGQGPCSCTFLRPWVGSLEAALVTGLYPIEWILVNLDNFLNYPLDFSKFLHAGLNQKDKNFCFSEDVDWNVFCCPNREKTGFLPKNFKSDITLKQSQIELPHWWPKLGSPQGQFFWDIFGWLPTAGNDDFWLPEGEGNPKVGEGVIFQGCLLWATL